MHIEAWADELYSFYFLLLAAIIFKLRESGV